jgi:hypothetical protein
VSFCRIGIFHCFATKAHLSYAVLTAGARGVVVRDAGAKKPIGVPIDLPRSGNGNDRNVGGG